MVAAMAPKTLGRWVATAAVGTTMAVALAACGTKTVTTTVTVGALPARTTSTSSPARSVTA
jgi:hypothetical protein